MEPVTLSPSALLAWNLANHQAVISQSESIEPHHVYLAILMMLDGIFPLSFQEKDQYVPAFVEIKALRSDALKYLGYTDEQLTQNRRRFSKKFIDAPEPECETSLNRSQTTRDLFANAIEQQIAQNGKTVTFLNLLQHINIEGMNAFAISSDQKIHQETNATCQINTESQSSLGSNPSKTRTPILDTIGRDLTALARNEKLPPVIGREAQMTAIARVLHRTSKRNAILIGEAGVGKTAIVEGLAQKIISELAIPELRSLRIVQVNIGDLVAGTSYRGQMEERVQGLIQEACSDPNLILFLDEIHLVVGSGTTNQSSMDLANLFKPALARDDFRCIGATTNAEYERYIKADSAFKRRFQIIQIPEPSRLEALAICKRWADRIQDHRQLNIELDAIEAAIDLSNIYLPDRRLPDKGIDLLENAAAFVDISTLDFDKEISTNPERLVTVDTIRTVLQEQYGIIFRPLVHQSPEFIASSLMEDLVGQDEAVVTIKRTLRRFSFRSTQNISHPMGVMLFTGPTGTGKTYTARCLASHLFPNHPDAFIRFSMNEYKERFDLSRLTGAAPGLIGHEQAGALFQFVETHPQGVILLDEIEKAHPEIQDFFLQIFDNGECRDSRGRLVHFRQHLFIMTANIFKAHETDDIQPDASFEHLLQMNFRPEFLGRVDQIIAFKELTLDDYLVLFDRQRKNLSTILPDTSVEILIDEVSRLNIVLQLSKFPDGARGFLRRFEQFISLPIAEALQTEQNMKKINVKFVNDKIIFDK